MPKADPGRLAGLTITRGRLAEALALSDQHKTLMTCGDGKGHGHFSTRPSGEAFGVDLFWPILIELACRTTAFAHKRIRIALKHNKIEE